jgi:hypothetical protein
MLGPCGRPASRVVFLMEPSKRTCARSFSTSPKKFGHFNFETRIKTTKRL